MVKIQNCSSSILLLVSPFPLASLQHLNVRSAICMVKTAIDYKEIPKDGQFVLQALQVEHLLVIPIAIITMQCATYCMHAEHHFHEHVTCKESTISNIATFHTTIFTQIAVTHNYSGTIIHCYLCRDGCVKFSNVN